MIKSLISNDDPQIQFYVIAGDNYYPLKHPEKNMKMFDNRDFDSGFECAKKLTTKGKPVYLLMGNHDLVHKKAIFEKKEDYEQIPRCHILKKQLSYEEYFDVNSIHKFLEKQETLLLFLNTTLYENDIDSKHTLECQQLYRKDYHSSIKENLESLIDFEEKVFFNLVSYF